ncbi:hypothetical protein EC09BKT78844_3029, partial [Escherichia coli 09BKT078844]
MVNLHFLFPQPSVTAGFFRFYACRPITTTFPSPPSS